MSERHDPAPLRRAFAARTTDRHVGEPPSAEELWALATGELEDPRASKVREYISRSSSGAAEWRATVEMVREAGLALPVAAEEPQPTQAARRPSRARWWLGWTAAAATAAAIAFFVSRPDPTPDVPPRTRATQPADIEALGPRSAQAGQPITLRWRGGAEGTYYDVRVLDQDLDVIHTAYALTDTSLVVPTAALAGARGVIYWQVVATVDAGERIESDTFAVTLEP